MQKNLTKKERKELFSELGRLGGKSNVRKHGKKHMSEIGKKGAKSRWKKTKK